jgi:hypothetical protein
MLPDSTRRSIESALIAQDRSQEQIALQFRVSRSTVCNIAKTVYQKTKPGRAPKNLQIGKCPTCYAKVKFPCIRCRVLGIA